MFNSLFSSVHIIIIIIIHSFSSCLFKLFNLTLLLAAVLLLLNHVQVGELYVKKKRVGQSEHT